MNADDRDDFARLLGELRAAAPAVGPIAGVAYLWGLDAPRTDALTAAALEESTLLTCRAPLHLVQAWEQAGPPGAVPCFVVTSAAQAAAESATPLAVAPSSLAVAPSSLAVAPSSLAVAQAPLIGMARVMASEYGRLKTRLVDLPADAAAELDALAAELRGGSAEDEVLLRDGGRWVRRFQPHRDVAACPAAAATLPAGSRWRPPPASRTCATGCFTPRRSRPARWRSRSTPRASTSAT